MRSLNMSVTLRLPIIPRKAPGRSLSPPSFVVPRPTRLVSGRPSVLRMRTVEPIAWPRTALICVAGAISSVSGTLMILGLLTRLAGPGTSAAMTTPAGHPSAATSHAPRQVARSPITLALR